MKLFILFLGFSAICFSQNISLVYEAKYILNTKTNDSYTDKMILDLKDNISLFRESEDKKADSLQMSTRNVRSKMGVENQFYIKKNLFQKRIEKIITYLGTNYVLPIDEVLDWKILPEHKIIGTYKCQKAVTDYGGRNWTAWFTTDIPISDGPYVFNGLPGLIVSIQDSNKEYTFNLLEMKKGGDIFDARTKTIIIDWKKYEALAKSYYNDPYDINSKTGLKVTFTNPDGRNMDISMMNKEIQEDVLKDNNPIELNHKINYK